MKRINQMSYEFVEFIPEVVATGTLYISTEYATATHRCCCGCGTEIVTPLGPTDWKLIFDGKSVSLTPSIGNWSLACRSHYWIREGQIAWAGDMSTQQITTGRVGDQTRKSEYFEKPVDGLFARVWASVRNWGQ